MENDFMQDENQIQEPQRPQFLKVLCILTFISTGISILGSLIIPAIGSDLLDIISKQPGFDPTKNAEAVSALTAGWHYYLVALALSLASLSGALLMWKLKKIGFHIYAIANILLFYIPIGLLNMNFSILSAFLPALFILFYALNFKALK